MYIQVLLKDGTYLKCVIFDENISNRSIGDENIIHEKFRTDNKNIHENFMQELIHFQTSFINGHFHPANVLWYNIVESNDEE